MRAFNIQNVAKDMGYCCAAAFLKVEEEKAKARGWPGISPAHLERKTGLAYRTCIRLKKRWQTGEIQCTGMENCLRHKFNDSDPTSAIDPEMKAFRALKHQSVTIYTAKFGKYELTREEPKTPAYIIDVARYPWLWIKVSLTEDREVYLGDMLWVENIAYGTVIDIEGRTLYILLPGHRHKRKMKG